MKARAKGDLRRAHAAHLTMENKRLRDRARVLEAMLMSCSKEASLMKEELRGEADGGQALGGRLEVLQEGIHELWKLNEEKERDAEATAQALGRCLRRENPWLIHKLAKVADLALCKQRFMPARLIRDMGWDYTLGHHCIQHLTRIGVFKRERYGHYVADPELSRENLGEEISRRRARHAGEKGVPDNVEEG